jgi:hypothetical protein
MAREQCPKCPHGKGFNCPICWPAQSAQQSPIKALKAGEYVQLKEGGPPGCHRASSGYVKSPRKEPQMMILRRTRKGILKLSKYSPRKGASHGY